MTERTVVRKRGGVLVERERKNREDRRTRRGQRAPGGSRGEKIGLMHFLLFQQIADKNKGRF